MNINHFYTQEQLDFIREEYYTKTCKEVAVSFNEHFKTNVTYNSIRGAIKRNNFHSSPEKQNAIKGKKQTDFMSEEAIEKSKATRFKKGQTAHNSFPIGHERPNKDGFIEIKVSAPVGENKKRSVWKLKHHLLWEDLNGPIPPKHKVIFADGNNRNFDINNLILISDSEFMSMRKYGLRYTTSIDAAKSGIVMTKILRKVNGVNEHAKS